MAKILLIEDDAIARMPIVQLLEGAGHQVLWAVDSLQGMAVFRGWQPDPVITDIIMPDQEGIQMIAEMRAAKPDAKIVAISGGGRIGNADFLQIARQLGAMEVVAKLLPLAPLAAIRTNPRNKSAPLAIWQSGCRNRRRGTKRHLGIGTPQC